MITAPTVCRRKRSIAWRLFWVGTVRTVSIIVRCAHRHVGRKDYLISGLCPSSTVSRGKQSCAKFVVCVSGLKSNSGEAPTKFGPIWRCDEIKGGNRKYKISAHKTWSTKPASHPFSTAEISSSSARSFIIVANTGSLWHVLRAYLFKCIL